VAVDRRILLLSVKPRFADAILARTKTVEVRRRAIRARAGTRVVLYASAPVKAVVGTAWLDRIAVRDAGGTWRQHAAALGLKRHELVAYLGGQQAHLLFLRGASRLEKPLSLTRLRRRAKFRPPQSFRYVSSNDPLRLRALGPTVVGGARRSN
jgi:predicted transcriptional regulator